jgi:CDP-diacylglycerol---serine O-phosphatidyltransferase
MKNQIPNLITLTNLFLGCLAAIAALNFDFKLTALFLLFAAFADLLDGAFARWLKVESPIGKDLDSLADMISFGFVPGTILYALWIKNSAGDFFTPTAFTCFIFTLGAALRLAIFNTTKQDKRAFSGLPTPAATLFVVGVMLSLRDSPSGTLPNWIFPAISITLTFFMLSKIPMFTFKIDHFNWKGNEKRLIFLLFAILSFLFFQQNALVIIVSFYIVFNILTYLISSKSIS